MSGSTEAVAWSEAAAVGARVWVVSAVDNEDDADEEDRDDDGVRVADVNEADDKEAEGTGEVATD